MQQVDLYVSALQPESHRPSLSQVVTVWIGLTFFCIGYSWYLMQSVDSKKAGLSDLQSQHVLLTQTVATVEKQLEAHLPDQSLVQENEQLWVLLKKGDELMKMTAEADHGVLGSQSMVQVLEGLARQGLEGIWLERIIIERGPELVIQGFTSNPEMVPVYLQRLGKEDVFSGMRFEDLTLVNESGVAPLAFRVASTFASYPAGHSPGNFGSGAYGEVPWTLE